VCPQRACHAHKTLHFAPVVQLLDRFGVVLRRRSILDLGQEIDGLTRQEQAVAFLALLELRRANQITISQAAPFAPIRIARTEESGASDERTTAWKLRSA